MKNKAKNSGSFFIPQRSRWDDLPENVQKVILHAKSNKARGLVYNFFHTARHLPKSLQIEQTKRETFKINKKLFLLSKRNDFGREWVEPEKYGAECFHNCFGILNENEYLQYSMSENENLQYSVGENGIRQYPIRETDLVIMLPKVDLITDYLALVEYYDDLIFSFNEVENGRKLQAPKTRHQLQTKLTDSQRGKLFDLLVADGFIPNTNKEGFIWAFGSEHPQPANWEQIEWIDKSTTRHEPNVQTLYELLFLLGVDKDTSANKPSNLYRKIEYCFHPLKNLAVKNPFTAKQNTPRKKLLKTIIEEAQK